MNPILKFHHIKKTYGKTTVIPDLNFTVQQGEFISLLGPSGCGKTTTLRLIAGLEEPSAGEIHINNQIVASQKHFIPAEKRNLGMVFQSYAIWPHMNVYENISYPLKIRKLSSQDIQNKLSKILEALHLTGLEKRHPHELSGGQQQRVALGRALVMEPLILLLDEPLSNLDAKLRIGMRKEIKDIQNNYKTTVIYVTHDQDEALDLSDRIILMNHGKIEQEGQPGDLKNHPKTDFVREFLS